MVWVLVGVRGCVAVDTGHDLVTLLSLSGRLRTDRCIRHLGKSQTYYPEHILGYRRREGLLLSCCGFRLFLDRLIGGGDGGGPCTTLSLGLWAGGLESKFGRGPGHPK